MTCRHCWREDHQIELCPDVLAAFGPVITDPNPKSKPTGVCKECGGVITRASRNAVYCSKKCYNAYNNRRQKERYEYLKGNCARCGVDISRANGRRYCQGCARKQYPKGKG